MPLTDSDVQDNPFLKIFNAIDATAPHALIQKIFIREEPVVEVAEEDSSVAAAAAALEREQAERPWTKPTYTERVAPNVEEDQRMQTYRRQGEQLVGERSRDGKIGDTRADGMVTVGLNSTWEEGPTDVSPPKAETVPRGLPFTNQRKSGKEYWPDEPKKQKVTQFF